LRDTCKQHKLNYFAAENVPCLFVRSKKPKYSYNVFANPEKTHGVQNRMAIIAQYVLLYNKTGSKRGWETYM